MGLLFSTMGVAFGEVNDVTPSTNEINKTKDWSHFDVLETRVGEVEVEIVNPRGFISCFEYRSDGEGPVSPVNYNTDITDGLWEFECVNDDPEMLTLSALEYVEIRMVFGGETDERFDWTRVDVLPAPEPEPEPGAQGLEKALLGPAGDHANENARFQGGNPKARFNR